MEWTTPKLRKINIFQHQNPAVPMCCIFPFWALDVGMLRSKRTGQGVPRALSVLLFWFLVSSLGLVQSCSSGPAISFQWGEQPDLRAHTEVVSLHLSFFPCWFSFSSCCAKIKIFLCYVLAHAYGPQVACHPNKQNYYSVGEMLLFLLLLVENNGKSGTKKTKLFFSNGCTVRLWQGQELSPGVLRPSPDL